MMKDREHQKIRIKKIGKVNGNGVSSLPNWGNAGAADVEKGLSMVSQCGWKEKDELSLASTPWKRENGTAK
jgi:hypothetical protein